MKIFFSITFFAFSLGLFAQSKTAIFNEKTYKIFPYRIQQETGTANSYFEKLENNTVPYCPQKLEDGDYLIYYKPSADLFYTKAGLKKLLKGDTFTIFSTFTIKNGLKEGAVSFYTYFNQKKPVSTGYYLLDFKTGNWLIKTKEKKYDVHYLNGLLDGKSTYISKENKSTETIIKNFKNGLADGIEEKYIGKKIKYTKTYKNGSSYGPYITYYTAKNRTEGYKVGKDMDSIINVYKDDKLILGIINSRNPFKSQYPDDAEWRVNYRRFEVNRSDRLPNYEISKNQHVYTYIFSLNPKGQRYNEFYLIDQKIKIPFTAFTELGDTAIKVSRIEKTATEYKYLINSKKYVKGKIDQEKLMEESCKLNFDKEYSKSNYSMTKKYVFNYYKTFVNKNFYMERPLDQFKGWIIKTDSTVTVNLKTQLPMGTAFENYLIAGDEGIFIRNNYFYNDSDPMTLGKYHFDFSDKDTLVLTKTEIICEDLKIKFMSKICLKDSSVTKTGDLDLINPYMIINSDDVDQYVGNCAGKVTYKNSPYTGALIYKEKLSKKLGRYDEKLSLKYKPKNIEITKVLPKERKIHKVLRLTWRFIIRRNDDYYVYSSELENQVSAKFNYKNGVLHGSQSATDQNYDIIYQLNFSNGQSYGTQNFNIDISDLNDKYRSKLLNQYWYTDGKIDGYVTKINSNRQPTFIAEYNKGKLNGTYADFSRDYRNQYTYPELLMETKFKNDTIIDELKIYRDGNILERVPFKNGQATGTYYRYNYRAVSDDESDSAHNYESYRIKYLELKAKLIDGYIKDSIITYFYDGGVKFIAVIDKDFKHQYFSQHVTDDNMNVVVQKQIDKQFDSTIKTSVNTENYYSALSRRTMFHFGVEKNSSNGTDGFDLEPLFDYTKAHFVFFYKNGIKSQEGNIFNNLKYGTWKYYSENGNLMKEIDYTPGLDSSLNYKVYYKGKKTSYYPSGKKLMEGLITDEKMSYQCSQEVSVAYEEVLYLNFYDEAGNQLLKNGTGAVVDYHLNGTKYMTGQITHGQRTGLWKFYDAKGNLGSIGEFMEDEKQGRWLSGDLAGINFVDNACSIIEVMSLINEKQVKDIDITETIYEMGKSISKSHLVLEKY